jgi:hypothetical protein
MRKLIIAACLFCAATLAMAVAFRPNLSCSEATAHAQAGIPGLLAHAPPTAWTDAREGLAIARRAKGMLDTVTEYCGGLPPDLEDTYTDVSAAEHRLARKVER